MTLSISESTQNLDSCGHISDTTLSGCTNVDSAEIDLASLPKVYIGTPWPIPYISAGFCKSLRNMFVPFPHVFETMSSRFLADSRNAIIDQAIKGGFDYVMQLDADQQFKPDFFLRLWEVIKTHGEDAIATGWAICKGGKFANESSVYRVGTDDIVSVPVTELEHRTEPFEVDAFGTCGFLASTSFFKKLNPPWFADINIIRDDLRMDEFHIATEFAMGQDLTFGIRAKEAGAKLIVVPQMRMPHEDMRTI